MFDTNTNYSVYVLTTSTQAEWDIHAQRCTHVRRGLVVTREVYIAKTGDTEAVRQDWLDDEIRELGFNENDVRIMACTAKAPTADGAYWNSQPRRVENARRV